MAIVYGVDFGTSNSSIVVGRSGGRVVRVRNPVESSYEVPSAVCLRSDGTLAVGSVAKRMKLQRPAWYRDEFKRDIGDPVPYNFLSEERDDLPGERSYHVYELVAEVLGLLRRQAERAVSGRPDLVVLTVPASWEAGNRDLMLRAAEHAGFPGETVRLITEPEASVAYAMQEHLGLRERTLLIYDLGGGTFDCALVRGRSRSDFEVLGEAGGLKDVGGALFDQQILTLIRERYPEQTGELLDGPPQDVQVMARRLQLRDTCENAKRVLSSEDRYEGLLTELGADVELVLTAEELAERLAPLIDETLDECERLLGSQAMDWDDIDGVVPVGGSVRLPMVGQRIARRTSRGRTSVQRIDEPELAVVHGAVLHAFDLTRTLTDDAPLLQNGQWPAPPLDPVPVPPVSAEIAAEDPLVLNPRTAEAVPPGPLLSEPPFTSELPAHATPAPPVQDVTFEAVNSRILRTLRRRNRIAGLSLTIAVPVLIAYLCGLHWTVGDGNHTDVIRVVILLSLGISVLFSALGARAMSRMSIDITSGAGEMAFSCVFLTASGISYYLWGGWWVILTVLLLILGLVLALDARVWIPAKSVFLAQLRIHETGMSFQAEDGGVAELAWAIVGALVLDGTGLDRALYAHLSAEAPPDLVRLLDKSPADKQEGDHVHRLFNRFHFHSGDDLLEAIRINSGGRLTGTW